jgi:hypothetical protein
MIQIRSARFLRSEDEEAIERIRKAVELGAVQVLSKDDSHAARILELHKRVLELERK